MNLKTFFQRDFFKRDNLIKNSFLVPILLVVLLSIFHITAWYDIGNPFAWAIYLSIAVEIFALASVSAASISLNRGSVWFLFILVTAIQIIGNVFFEFNDMDEKGKLFLSWVELVKPFFEDWSLTDHRRLLSIMQGATIPMMSLVALNYYIKSGDKQKKAEEFKTRGFWTVPPPIPVEPIVEVVPQVPPSIQVPEEVKPIEPIVATPMEKIIDSIVDIPEKEEQPKINRIDDDGIAPYAIHHE